MPPKPTDDMLEQRLGGGLGVLQGGDQRRGIVTAAVNSSGQEGRSIGRRSSSMPALAGETTPSASGHPCWRTPRPARATTPRSGPASAGSCRFQAARARGYAARSATVRVGRASGRIPSRRTVSRAAVANRPSQFDASAIGPCRLCRKPPLAPRGAAIRNLNHQVSTRASRDYSRSLRT